MSFLRPALVSTALLLPACLVEGDPDPMQLDELIDVEERCIACGWGPPVLNTHGLNGLPVAALDTTGDMYDGWRLKSILVVGDDREPNRSLVNVFVDEGVLFGSDQDGTQYEGEDFVDSIWTVELEETGALEVMTVHDFIEDPAASRYVFFFGGGTIPNKETFTCPQDPDTGENTVVLFANIDVDTDTGTHFDRNNTIYFGCSSGAVGKAATWGYSPWNTTPDGHQTASRVVRADYCGNGSSYTIQGTGLQVADVFGVNAHADPYKSTEALWGPGGALCLLEPRLGYEPHEIECGGQTLPLCGTDSGFGDWTGSLLWTKTW